MSADDLDREAFAYAERWCQQRGSNWQVLKKLGRGGTAPVFLLHSPQGNRALKILDPKFSEGRLGEQTETRIKQQVALGDHGCPQLVICYDGAKFEDRLFLLMNCAEGQELEKRLLDIPRSKIRLIVDQITRAVIFLRKNGLCHRDIKSANIFISDDFERATLLDLSVIRGINDPIGVGTDHDNQLPVVATSRYTPPEYLFRLLEPSAELWHGVDVYQLGGLLHDLIMRQPMFSNEYAASSENRYRFAWVVATSDPVIKAADVDADLTLLARRALDKKWSRRHLLQVEDFLIERRAKQSLAAIGIAPTPRPTPPLIAAPKPSEVLELAKRVSRLVQASLYQQNNLRVKCNVVPGKHDLSKILRWEWDLNGLNMASHVELEVCLELCAGEPHARARASVQLRANIDDNIKMSSIDLPESNNVEEIDEELSQSIIASLNTLSKEATRAVEKED